MTNWLWFAALGALLAREAVAQTGADDTLPNVASLRAPATPAFTLLGVSPTDVARPQTPGDLGLSLANRLSGSTQIPSDVAIEASPYWMLQHSRLTWRSDTTRNIAESIARTFAFSVGTTNRGGDGQSSTALGTGVRTMLLSGRLSDTTVKLLAAVEKNAAAQGEIFNRYRKSETERIDALVAVELRPCVSSPDPVKCAADVAAKYQPMRDSVTRAVLANPGYQREIEEAKKEIDDFSLVREGWFLELAGGAVWEFKDAIWSAGRHARTGGWATLSHEGGKLGRGATWTPILVARYVKEDTAASLGITDLGGSVVISGPQYAVSAELVHRFWAGTNPPSSQHRFSGMFEYKLRENSWLFGAVGKDYADATKDSFITRFGLSISLKKERYKTTD